MCECGLEQLVKLGHWEIAELGAQLSQTQESEDDQKKVQSEFERMAKELDVYFVAEDTSM